MNSDDSEPSSASASSDSPGAPLAAFERPPIPPILSILPKRGAAVFPGVITSLSIGRPASRKLLEESLPQSKIIGIFTQKNPEQENPGPADIHRVGVAVVVLKLLRQPDDSGVVIAAS